MPSQHALGSMAPQMVTLPSMRDADNHNTCMVKRLTPADMIAGDLLDRFDSLTGIVGLEIDKINGRPTTDLQDMLGKLRGNKEQIKAALGMVDEIVEMSLVDPRVYRPIDAAGNVIPFADRDAGKIWTDMVDPEDKNAIVEFAMQGVRALEPFRDATSGGVGPVRTKSKVRKPAKRVAGG